MLRCEQKPSIHGERYFDAGSTPVLLSIQSRVPGFAFSTRMGLGMSSAPRLTTDRSASARVAAPVICFRAVRREVGRGWFMIRYPVQRFLHSAAFGWR